MLRLTFSDDYLLQLKSPCFSQCIGGARCVVRGGLCGGAAEPEPQPALLIGGCSWLATLISL